ncbi:MAG: sugar phosphate isomerase/epimerase [Lentisphaerae bacterium]|nr:sugar phosphate isomerase/epimerase [Lentisphaerota bacterium]
MKLSMMSYTLARLPGFSVPGMFTMAKELQLEGVDMVTLYGHSAREIRNMAADHDLPIVAYTFPAGEMGKDSEQERQIGVDKAKVGIDTAVELGAPVVMIPPGPPADCRDAKRCRDNYIKGLQKIADYALQAQVILTVENFPGQYSPFVTADDFLAARAEVPGLMLTFDNGNAASGEDVAASFTKVAPYVVHAHFKDWKIRTDPAEGWRLMRDGRYYQAALIGEGNIDQKATIAAMKKAGYDKYINVEYEGNAYSGEEAMRRAVRYLRELLAES